MKVDRTQMASPRRAHNSSWSDGIAYKGLRYVGPTHIFREVRPEPAVPLQTFTGRISRLSKAESLNDQSIHEALYLSAKDYQAKYGVRKTYVQLDGRKVELNAAYRAAPFQVIVPYSIFRFRVVSFQKRGVLDVCVLQDAISMSESEWMSFYGGGNYKTFIYDGVEFSNQIGKQFHSVTSFLRTVGHYSKKSLVWSRLKSGWSLDSAISVPVELPRKRSGLIYKITRKRTGEVYVGLSVATLKQRWTFHLQAVRSGSQTKFARAIREDGADGFVCEVIEDGILDSPTLREREIYWVDKLNALGAYGLNTAKPGGLGGAKGIKTTVSGEDFRSLQEASQVIGERLGIPDYAVMRRIKSGAAIPLRIRKQSKHPEAGSNLFRRWLGLIKRHPNDVSPSWMASYDVFRQDVSPVLLGHELVRKDDTKQWGRNNFFWVTTQKKNELVHGKVVSIHGMDYPSLRAVAEKFGIGVSTLKDRIGRQGMSIEDAVDSSLGDTSYKRIGVLVEIDGRIFRSKRQASVYLMGKGMTEYFARLHVDAIVAQAVNTEQKQSLG